MRRISLLTFALYLSAFSVHAAQGPSVQYNFDEGTGTVANDASGNGNTATLVNGPVWTSGPSGGGGALMFDGVNDYVSNSAFNWTGGAVTVTFWNFVPTAPTTSGCWTFFVGANSTNRMGVICPDSDSKIYWDYGNPSGNGRLTFDYTPYIGKWTHVTLVSSGSGGTYNAIYLNGQLSVFSVAADSPQVTITGLQLGHSAMDAIGTRHFNGTLRDFRIYNRVLSDTEIAAAAQLAPVASPETYATSAAGALNVPTPGVLSNDTDYNGDSLTAVLDITTTHGTLALNANGSFTYTANNGFSGNDTFNYHALDSAGNASNSVTVTIQVSGNALITAISPTSGTAGTVLTNVSLTGTGFQQSAASRPANATSFRGHDYAYVNTAANWSAAKANCIALGGHLATLTSVEENQFVYNLGGLTPAWIGFTDEVTEGTFLWANGDPVTYTNWQSGRPNGGTAANYTQFSATVSGAWADVAGATSLPYVCEFDSSVTPRVILVGASTIEGYNVRWNSATQLLFDINLTGAAGGKYFVELINPDGLVTVSNQLFSISPTRWHLTIPIPGAVQVTNSQIYTAAFPVASSGDATATVSYMELDATDTSINQRLYDCVSLLHTTSTFDTTTYSAKMGAGQLGRYTNYPNPTMNLFIRYDFENALFNTDEPGNGTGSTFGRTTFSFDSTKTLWARIYTYRGDGNPGNTLTNVKLLVNMDSATMPGAYMTGNSQKTLQWTVSPAREAVTQKLYKASALAGPFTLVSTINDNTTNSYQDLTIQYGVPTYYKVIAQTADGSPGAESNVLTIALTIPLQVTAMSPAPNAVAFTSQNSITVDFSSPVAASSVNPASVLLVRAGPDGVFDTADDVTIQLQASQIAMTTSTRLTISGLSLPADKYRISLIGAVKGTTSSSDAIVTVPNFGLVTPTDNYTIEFWQYFTGGQFHLPTTFQLTPIIAGNVYQFHSPWNSGPDYFFWDLGGDRNGITNVGTRAVWAHFALVKSGTNIKVYWNGSLIFTGTLTTAFTNYLSDLQLPAGGPQPFLGRIDEFRIWNVLRSATQIKTYMNRTLSGNEPGLMAYWDFNEGTGTTANDKTGHGYTGTMATPAVWTASDVPLIPPLTDQSGNILDGEFSGAFPSGNGISGGDFNAQFTVIPQPLNVTTMSPAPNVTQFSAISSILLTFNSNLDATTVSTSTIHLKSAGVDGIIDTIDDVVVTPSAVTVVNNNQVKVDFTASAKQIEKYRVTLNGSSLPAIKSTTAAVLDGEYPGPSGGFPSGDGVPGGDFSVVFGVDTTPATIPTTLSTNAVGPIGYGASSVAFSATVNSSQTVNAGTITFQLMNGAANVGSPATSGTVSNGVASANYSLPSGTPIGTYTISAAYSGGGGFISSTDSSKQLTLNATPLSVTADNANRAYGTANPVFTGVITGVQTGDTITATYASSASVTSGLGTYSILPTLIDPGNKLGNYVVTPQNGTLTVTAAPLTVTPANVSRGYGVANPTLTGTITGLKNGDNITATYATSATPSSPVGPYNIVATLVDPNGKLGNYALTQNTGTLTVNKVALSVTGANASRAYAAANPALSGTITGIQNGDNISATYSTSATSASMVGPYPIVPTLVDPGSALGNYTVTSTSGTLTVTKVPLTVSADSFQRAYGAANPTFTGTLSGVVNGDNITTTYSTSATVSSSIGNYSIVPVLADPGSKLGNYTVTSNNGVLTISNATVVLAVTPDSFTRTYGDPNPTLTGTIVGILNGDNITATYSVPANILSVPGNYFISATLVDPGNKLPNYTVNANVGELTVNRADVSATGGSFSRVYGAVNPTLSGTIVGIKNGDNISATYVTAATTTSSAGAYPVVPTMFDPGNKLANYNLTIANGSLSVTAAPLSVTPANASRAYGSANPLFTGTVTGVLNGDGIGATYVTIATTASPVGTYPITATLTDPNNKAGNYAVTLNTGTLTITTAPAIIVTPANASRNYGATNPAFTGTITGVLNGDNITATYATAATPASLVGNYAIVPTLVDPTNRLGNYALVTNAGTLAIVAAPLTVTPDDTSRIYGRANPAFTGSITGIQNNDAITASYATAATPASAVGTYSILATLADPDSKLVNYTVTTNTGTLTIAKVTPIIAWPQPARIFAGVPLDSTQFNAAANDPFTTSTVAGTFAYAPVAGTVLLPGLGQTLNVVFTPDDSSIYAATSASNSLDVDPAILVAITSAATASGTQGAPFSYTITATGSAPMTFNADGLPAGLSLTGSVISGVPTMTGVFDIVLTVANYAGSASQPLKLVVAQAAGTNHAPVFDSPPKASANPATTGVTLTLTASATDADGDALDYTWDFGDGTTGVGASVSKTFVAAGAYVVKVVVSDGQATDLQSIVIVVNDQPTVATFTVTKVKLIFNFAKSGSDSLSVSGTIPIPVAFNPAGKKVRVLIGEFDMTYILNAKGASTDKAFKFKGKLNGTSAAFTFMMKKQTLFPQLENLGFSKTLSNPALDFPVVIVLDGASSFAHPAINYTVKSSKKGPMSGIGKK